MKITQEPQPISVSEAHHLLEPLRSKYKNTRSESYQVYYKTLEYTKMLCRIDDKSLLEDLKFSLAEFGLNDKEISIILTLLPKSASDAKMYVPTLSRFDGDIMKKIIEKIRIVDE